MCLAKGHACAMARPAGLREHRTACINRIRGLRGDEFVVLTVRSDPEPMDTGRLWQAQSTLIQTHASAVQLAPTEQLELKRWMPGILL